MCFVISAFSNLHDSFSQTSLTLKKPTGARGVARENRVAFAGFRGYLDNNARKEDVFPRPLRERMVGYRGCKTRVSSSSLIIVDTGPLLSVFVFAHHSRSSGRKRDSGRTGTGRCLDIDVIIRQLGVDKI